MVCLGLTIKRGLFGTGAPEYRDFFINDDIRTLRYDVEQAVNAKISEGIRDFLTE